MTRAVAAGKGYAVWLRPLPEGERERSAAASPLQDDN